jgi:cell division septation protein DedD
VQHGERLDTSGSMTRILVLAAILTLGALVRATPAMAQATESAAAQTRDTLYLRARRLVLDGNGAAGRTLVDSALAATAGTAEYATALYWHGALSSTAADAERDYRRVIVEYPFSQHAGDALLALAQLEMARGDRDPAIDHLQRFLLQRPNDPDRVRAGIWLGRMLLEQNQLPKGCAVLLRTRASLGDTAIEVRNQVDYYAARCAGVDTTPPAPRPAASSSKPASRADSAAQRGLPARDSARTDASPRPPVRRDSVRSDSTTRATKPRDTLAKATTRVARPASAPNAAGAAEAGRFTIQVAAYDTRRSAEQLVDKLSARGIVARVVGGQTSPYRVRIGHYANDAAATAAARGLKDKGITGFVTTTDNEGAPAPERR